MASSTLDALLDELSARMVQRQKHDSPTGTPSLPYMHGPGGLFGVAGISRDLISTRVQPRGIASVLPTRGTIQTDPMFGYITGFLAPTGSDPDGVCDDPAVAGAIKGCLQTAAFGRYSYRTRELEINRLGQQVDRGEFLDLRVINDPLLQQMGSIVQPEVGGNLNLNREMLVRMLEVGVAYQNKLIPQVYTGNPVNNTGAGGYKEFPGLDILIGTNKYDAITGARCPSLDSDIKDFNYGRVDTASGGTDIVEAMTYLYRYLRNNGSRMGFDPVQWVITMRQTLFWELTSVWPCSYLTYRCFMENNGVNQLVVSAAEQVRLRDEMRNGEYLLIDGFRVPVILDDGIVEESSTTTNRVSNTCFASDIYFIPLTVRGGLAATYWEHLDYSRGAMIGAEDGRYTPGDFWTDGGRYLWHKEPPKQWCIQLSSKIEPRLILLTPQLAGRLTNVQYCPLQHERTPFPGDAYFVNGGVTNRAGPSHFSDWNPGS